MLNNIYSHCKSNNLHSTANGYFNKKDTIAKTKIKIKLFFEKYTLDNKGLALGIKLALRYLFAFSSLEAEPSVNVYSTVALASNGNVNLSIPYMLSFKTIKFIDLKDFIVTT